MRHAEAEPQTVGTDHARPLTRRGKSDARAMTQKLAASGWSPTRILSSDSQRTRETSVSLAEAFDARVSWHAPLYLGGTEAVEEVLRGCVPTEATVLLLGHNPGFSEVASLLAGGNVSLGTAHAALLSIDAEDWSEALTLAGSWTLEAHMTP